MARVLLSNGNNFLPSFHSSSSSSSSSTVLTSLHVQKQIVRTHPSSCKSAMNQNSPPPPPLLLTKRSLSISLTTGFIFFLSGKAYFDANAAILEADDDEELLEKVKKDRKKRLERQSVINSASQETG